MCCSRSPGSALTWFAMGAQTARSLREVFAATQAGVCEIRVRPVLGRGYGAVVLVLPAGWWVL